MIDIAKLESEYSKEIARVDRLSNNIMTIKSIEYSYTRLIDLRFEPTMEFMLEVEALTTGLVVSYGRLFTGSDGTTRLNENNLPIHLLATHREIMALRNKRYAHHGAHPSVMSKISLATVDDDVVLIQQMNISFWVGAAKHWAPLFEWLQGHIYDLLQKALRNVTEKSCVKWRMDYGPHPKSDDAR